MSASLQLSPIARRTFDRLAADVTRVFGARFVSLVAYSEHESVAFAKSVTGDDLDALSSLVESWHRDGLATPLLVTPEEFTRSLDAFPLEYQAILDRHVVIAGADPIGHASVDPNDLRRACETHAKGHLIHLRQGWLQAAGHHEQMAALLVHSAAPLRALLVSVARLLGTDVRNVEELSAFTARTIGAPADLIGKILALESAPDGSDALISRFGEYLNAAERLWVFIDGWRSA